MKLRPLEGTFCRTGAAAASWRRSMSHSAHTLIELLVVIAILGLLTALYLTAVSKAKAKGLQTQCASNLRQLALALEQYVSDNHAYPFLAENGDGLPSSDVALGRYAGGYRVNTDRKPYQSAGLFHCPAANPPPCPTFPEGILYEDYGYNAFGVCSPYGTNGSLGLSPWIDAKGRREPLPIALLQSHPPVDETQIASPTEMMAIGDGFAGNGLIMGDATTVMSRFDIPQDRPPGSTRRVYARHKGKQNVVFCDGHLEVLLVQTVFGDNNDGVLSRWNRDNQPHSDRLRQRQ